MFIASALPEAPRRLMPLFPRPNLIRLALLAAAASDVTSALLDDPVAFAATHPHYPLNFDDRDREILSSISARSHTVEEFLRHLADAADGAPA